jgi:hypothetical protein
VSATISVTRAGAGDPLVFDVTIREGAGETRHRVTLARSDVARLGAGAEAEAILEAAFCFLLDREPKESILSGFDVSAISRYFPEFEKRLPDYLG